MYVYENILIQYKNIEHQVFEVNLLTHQKFNINITIFKQFLDCKSIVKL